MRATVTALTLAIAAVIGTAVPGLAKVTQYDCKFPRDMNRGGGWIPEVVFVFVDEASEEVTVYDPVIDQYYGNPIPVSSTKETKVRKTFSWKVNFQNRGQSGVITYSLSYFSNGNAAKMSAQPGSYDNKWTGEGSCTVSVK